MELEIHIKALAKERDTVLGQLKWCWHNPNNNNNKKQAHFHQIWHWTQKKTPLQSLLSRQSKARLLSDSHTGESPNSAVSSSSRSEPPWTTQSPPREGHSLAQSWDPALSLSILLFSGEGSSKRINWGHQEAGNTALGLSWGKGKGEGKSALRKSS